MKITCPRCHNQCFLQEKTGPRDNATLVCPTCGHSIIIPPGTLRRQGQKTDPQTSTKKSQEDLKPQKPVFRESPELRRLSSSPNLLFWLLSGIGLIFLAIILMLGPQERRLSENTTKQDSSTLATTAVGTSPPPPNQQKQQEALRLIKKHALVRDADISSVNNTLHLALLVTDKTPVSDAERLGRSFAHYLFDGIDIGEMPQNPVQISVYYPQGSRVTVAINKITHEKEEEILGDGVGGDRKRERNQ
ncbi:MAG: hypothetical protein JXR89_05425 [Deltaproteobacteria bacterium]|nr:hypothetical protein [Deltaproteobacteria bacterium]